MFDLSAEMAATMAELEARDARDRLDGTPREGRLRQIPPETGRLLALLCAGAPAGQVVEVGTSAGYSSLWLSLGCAASGRQLTTFEVDPRKVALARETFTRAGVAEQVELVEGDLRQRTEHLGEVAFCFLDAEKDLYEEIADLVLERLVPGGLLVADNVLSHREELAPFVERSLGDPRLDGVVVPIGKGELVLRRRGTEKAST